MKKYFQGQNRKRGGWERIEKQHNGCNAGSCQHYQYVVYYDQSRHFLWPKVVRRGVTSRWHHPAVIVVTDRSSSFFAGSVVIAQRKTWNNSLKIRRQRTLKRITLMAAVSKSHRAEIIHQHPTLQPSSTCEGHYNTYSGDKAEKSRTVFTQSWDEK